MIVRLALSLPLLAGAAATTALFVRVPLANLVAKSLDRDVHDLAERARVLAPPVRETRETQLAPVLAPLPLLEPEKPPLVVAQKPAPAKPTKSKPKATAFVVTQQELEAGVAAHGWGARAVAVKDGLELHSVGRFARFGVAEGDVLVSANGYSLRTADEALAALGKLGDSRSIVVVLRRGERSYAVPLELVAE
ncbi:MAG: hypothetical protein ACXVEF_01670 [Polyangiales bacterium]